MKVVAIIPARKGSKGVPGKNRKVIDGKPLISYTIEESVKCQKVSEIWVSTDDQEIVRLASEYKEIKIHERPPHLAADNSKIGDAVAELVQGIECDAILLLQPTSPLRTVSDIDSAIDLLESNSDCNTVISVTPMTDIHPGKMYWIKNQRMECVMPEYENTHRQDTPPAYLRNGCIYIVRRAVFDETRSFTTEPILPYVMNPEWLLNIDEERDLLMAEVLIPEWKKKMASYR